MIKKILELKSTDGKKLRIEENAPGQLGCLLIIPGWEKVPFNIAKNGALEIHQFLSEWLNQSSSKI